MNETSTKEVNLKWLLYRALRAWKSVIIWAVIIALLCGMASVGLRLLTRSNTKAMTRAKQDFIREYASWVATGESLVAQLENLETAKDRQEEYNENSVMMEIDPLRKNIATFQLYVNYEYTITSDMTAAGYNPDKTHQILAAYATYMTSGDMYSYIIENLSYDIELRYLTEILSVSTDSNSKTISVTVVHTDAEKCQEILSLVQAGINSRYQTVCDNVAVHTLAMNNQTAYETIDLALEDTQKANLQYITDIDITIQDVNEQYREWRKEPEPEFKYSVKEIIKNGIVVSVVAGVVSLIVLFAGVAVAAMTSGKLRDPSDMKTLFGLRVIGLLPNSNKKKAFNGITKKITKLGGVKIKQAEYESLAKMIGSSIKSDVASREGGAAWRSIVFTGSGCVEELQRAVAAMGIDGYDVVCAPDVLANAESIDKVAAADCVVLVETQEKALAADIEKQLEALKAWNKPVIGAVVINADAII